MKYTVAEFRKNTREILNAVDQGAEVLIQRYDSLYRINAEQTGTFVVDPKAVAAVEPDEKAPEKNIAIGKPIKKEVSKIPKGVEPVDSCPHGFAKGFCKKADCNRKYQK